MIAARQDEPRPEPAGSPRPRLHHHYGVVLALILASLAFQLAADDGDVQRLIAVVLQAMTLVAAVVASRAHPW
jgi:hypothetical protein